MKKHFVLITIFTISITTLSFSQDIMTTKNGDEIKIKVLEVLPDLVKFKKWDNQDGPSYTEYKANIFMIKYQNGSKDVFKQQSSTQDQNPKVSSEEIQKDKAVQILNNFFTNRFSNDRAFNMLYFKKTNGKMNNTLGQSVYEIDFELKLEFKSDAWMKGNGLEGYWRNDFKTYTIEPDLRASGEQFMYGTKFFQKGEVYIIRGTSTMENTDNGYKLEEYQLKTITPLGRLSSTGNSSQQKSNASGLSATSNNSATYKKFNGFLATDDLKTVIKISNIRIIDELNNSSEAQNKIFEILTNMRRMQNPNINLGIKDTLELEATANFAYRTYTTSQNNSYYLSDCNLELKLTGKKTPSNIIEKNYLLQSKGSPSALDANKDIIETGFNQAINQFIIGNFPLVGEIIEVTEKTKKQDEAKIVKINLGKKDGLLNGYSFIATDINMIVTKPDIVVNNVFEDYSLCKAQQNEKKILEYIRDGKKLVIRTTYKP